MNAARDRMTKSLGAGTSSSGGGGGGQAAPKDGDRAKSNSGKPIVYRNSRWEYEQ
jgi:hypothetical protein